MTDPSDVDVRRERQPEVLNLLKTASRHHVRIRAEKTVAVEVNQMLGSSAIHFRLPGNLRRKLCIARRVLNAVTNNSPALQPLNSSFSFIPALPIHRSCAPDGFDQQAASCASCHVRRHLASLPTAQSRRQAFEVGRFEMAGTALRIADVNNGRAWRKARTKLPKHLFDKRTLSFSGIFSSGRLVLPRKSAKTHALDRLHKAVERSLNVGDCNSAFHSRQPNIPFWVMHCKPRIIAVCRRPDTTVAEDIFRNLLKETRVAKNLTQSDVSKSLGLPQSYVSKYESGEPASTSSKPLLFVRR